MTMKCQGPQRILNGAMQNTKRTSPLSAKMEWKLDTNVKSKKKNTALVDLKMHHETSGQQAN